MLCIEWWAYEIGSFLSGQCGKGGVAGGSVGAPSGSMAAAVSPPGTLGTVELGAQSIVYELATIVYMVSAESRLCGGARCSPRRVLRMSTGTCSINNLRGDS